MPASYTSSSASTKGPSALRGALRAVQGRHPRERRRLREVARLARRDEPLAAAAVLQLALDMELRAYDLYRSAAVATEKPSLRAFFLRLADQEKGHARELGGAMAELGANLQGG